MIEIEGLYKSYGETRALNGVTLSITPGGIVGLLGPNGAGKTTLVEIIEGLRPPGSGRVSVLGFDPTATPRELRERIGAQLQSAPLPQDLTPTETLRVFGALYRRHRHADDILASVGLVAKAKTRNRHLSGGQKRRLAIAMALVNDPELIVLDEPTSGLDPVARREIHRLISDLRSAGRTVLLTTHYIEEAEELCDRVIILRSGEVVADDTPFELVAEAAGASSLWIASEGELDTARLVASGAIDEGRDGRYLRFKTTDPTSAILALGEILREGQASITDIRMKRPGLEDVYLELMGVTSPDDLKGIEPDRRRSAGGEAVEADLEIGR